MSAITAALSQIDRVAEDGELASDPAAPLELETAGEPILLPDGRRIYRPCLHGQPIDELALALLDMDDPAQSTFLRLIGPPDPVSHCPPRCRHWSNSPAPFSDTLILRPFRRPCVTWTACSSPRWTLCKTVWRAQPRRLAASSSGT